MKDEDDYITIKIPKKALSGICDINIDNSVVQGTSGVSDLPLCWVPHCSFSVYYYSEYRDEVNRVINEIMLEIAKQKGGMSHLD